MYSVFLFMLMMISVLQGLWSVTVSAKKKLKNLLNALTNTVRTFITITRDITGRMRDIMTSVLTVQNSVLEECVEEIEAYAKIRFRK